MREIFLTFLRLGCYAFGGPTAHLGYFHEEFVKRRRWMDEAEYADTVALCQFLPGPSSSQVGFAIGLRRGGPLGAFMAWTGFTAPSAILMIALAVGLASAGNVADAGWITGLKLVAVAVVANAAWGMANTLCPDRARATIAAVVVVALLLFVDPLSQLAAILGGALAGVILYRNAPEAEETAHNAAGSGKAGRRVPAAVLLGLFLVLLFALPVVAGLAPEAGWLQVTEAFYRAGSLVFGGGHVVLPLLDSYTAQRGWIEESTFLAGYGAAQALPGPLFAFSSFLGASISKGPGGVAGGLLALIAIYLPSWLLVLGALPFWARLRRARVVRAALMGANAAVVGLLFAALYDPIWKSSVSGNLTVAFALVCFVALRAWKAPAWAVALAGAGVGQLAF